MEDKEREDIKEQIIRGLGELPSSWTHFFKLKLSPNDNRPIVDIVNDMTDDVLLWSLGRINDSLKKLDK
jgi:hypothetical protein